MVSGTGVPTAKGDTSAAAWPPLNPTKRFSEYDSCSSTHRFAAVFARLTEEKSGQTRDVTVGDLIKTIRYPSVPSTDGTVVDGGLLIGRRNTSSFPSVSTASVHGCARASPLSESGSALTA